MLVSGGGTNLQALIDAQKNGIITSGEIKLVVSSNKNAYALKRAENAGIKTVCVPKKNEKDVEEVSAEITKGLEIVYVESMDEVLEQAFTA